jgi:tetratricopeptide (TPR) repeat protein
VIIFSFSVAHAAEEYEILIAKGIQKINEGMYEEALELLNRALEIDPGNKEARFYSAVAMSRLGNTDTAEELLKKMLDEGETAEDVYFELGRIAYVKADCSSAESYLSTFIDVTDDESRKNYASSLIDDCKADKKPETAEAKYRLNITAGFEYDSNVVLEPSNPVVRADEDDDGRAVFLLNGGLIFAETEDVRIRGDYLFYQSLHFDLNDFNVHYHKPSMSAEFLFSKNVIPTVGYRFEYVYFGDDLYGSINTLFGELNIRESKNCNLDLIYEYRYHKYWDTDLFRTNSLRTGRRYRAGVRQNFTWNDLEGDIHYYYNDKRARVDYWEFTGNRVGTTLSYQITEPVLARISADYYNRDYDGTFPGATRDREDDMYRIAIRLTYAFTDRIAVSLTERYTRNDSNMATYDYDRNVIGLLFTYGVI